MNLDSESAIRDIAATAGIVLKIQRIRDALADAEVEQVRASKVSRHPDADTALGEADGLVKGLRAALAILAA